MRHTRATMIRINEVNDLLIKAKYILIDAEKIASAEERELIAAVQKHVQQGIKEILHNFFPKTEFNESAWLKRRTTEDELHDQRVQQILDDAAQRQEESIEKGKEAFDRFQEDCQSNLEKTMKKIRFGNSGRNPKIIEENETCRHSCNNCEDKIVVGDEDHCLQGEVMDRQHPDDYPYGDDGHEIITGRK